MKKNVLFIFFLLIGFVACAQMDKLIFPLEDISKIKAFNVDIKTEKYKDNPAIMVADINPESNSELRFAKLLDGAFHNGIIKVELAGKPMENSPESSRGFVGIAFRIEESNSMFECIYLRPTNGRSEDQIRRNHSVQYISYPYFPWYKLRKEHPEKYESYVDLKVGEWTKIKIEVKEDTAKLFVHNNTQPTLIVSDLKNGSNQSGNVGLWIGPGTEAYFKDLIIIKHD